jgi:hypothetical protein
MTAFFCNLLEYPNEGVVVWDTKTNMFKLTV